MCVNMDIYTNKKVETEAQMCTSGLIRHGLAIITGLEPQDCTDDVCTRLFKAYEQ